MIYLVGKPVYGYTDDGEYCFDIIDFRKITCSLDKYSDEARVAVMEKYKRIVKQDNTKLCPYVVGFITNDSEPFLWIDRLIMQLMFRDYSGEIYPTDWYIGDCKSFGMKIPKEDKLIWFKLTQDLPTVAGQFPVMTYRLSKYDMLLIQLNNTMRKLVPDCLLCALK